jgi:hypothetical protein
MNKDELRQQNLEEDNFCSYNQNKIYTKRIDHSLPFEKKQTAEVMHLQDIIKRSKTSPSKKEPTSDDESRKTNYNEKETQNVNRSLKFQKLKQKLSEKMNNISEYEIELGEKDFKEQISERIKERNDLENNDINISDINNLRILDSFGGNRTQNKQQFNDENNTTSLEKKLFRRFK